MTPTLHLLGIPHTITRADFSHDAFTNKVRTFGPMMRAAGYDVIHYGWGEATVEGTKHVCLGSEEEFAHLAGLDLAHLPPTFQWHTIAKLGSPHYAAFTQRLLAALPEYVAPRDILCFPFGRAHEAVAEAFPHMLKVESGIGYPESFLPFRIFESYAWLHNTAGRAGSTWGNDYWWVIPNGFDLRDWQLRGREPSYVLYMGRICQEKGLDVFAAMAEARPDLHFLMVGQGDPGPWLARGLPNLEYRPPVSGTDRAALYEGAIATVAMSRYLEPFGQVHAEALLMGCPVIVSDYGAYPEYVTNGVDGYRCRTLGDCLAALERLERWDRMLRARIRTRAADRFDLYVVAEQYARVFEQLSDLWDEGWYRHRSVIGSITKAVSRATPTPWEQAQTWERAWWMADRNGRWAREAKKQRTYASLMGLPDDLDVGDKTVLDLGCGPVSLLHRAIVRSGTAVDPLDFGDATSYADRGVQRVYTKAEEFRGGPYDEIWLYNVLQHVEDPQAVLATAKASVAPGGCVRVFEWINTPPCPGHLHELTESLFADAFAGWRRDRWATDRLTGPMWEMVPGDYFVGVVRPPLGD